MQITPSSLASIKQAFNLFFQRGFSSAQPRAARLAMSMPSGTKSNVYALMAQMPRMREWLGERVVQNLSSHTYELVNKDYEATVSVLRNDIEDDQLGVYNPLFEEFGRVTSLWMDDLLIQALKDGGDATLGKTYDGVAFFSASHPKDPGGAVSGTQSNLFTTTALTAANFATVRAAMMSLVGHDNGVMDVMPNLLIVPPALGKTAREIVGASILSNNSNVLAGMAEVLVLPHLAGADTTWYLMDTSKAVKPLVSQTRRAPRLVRFDSPNDESVYKHKRFEYGNDARGAAGYGLWFLAAKCTA